MERLLQIFKALSDRNRLRIIAALLHCKELCACQLTELLGVAGATASRHLAQLQNAGLIEGRKHGRWIFFRLSKRLPENLSLEWLKERVSRTTLAGDDRKLLESILAEDPEVICRRQRGETDGG